MPSPDYRHPGCQLLQYTERRYANTRQVRAYGTLAGSHRTGHHTWAWVNVLDAPRVRDGATKSVWFVTTGDEDLVIPEADVLTLTPEADVTHEQMVTARSANDRTPGLGGGDWDPQDVAPKTAGAVTPAQTKGDKQ